jgi:hypothetical protein
MIDLFEELLLDSNSNKQDNDTRVKMITELLKQRYITDPIEYFTFLSSYQPLVNPHCIIGDCAFNPHKRVISDWSSYDTVSFRTCICELFYHAINSFPMISEYTIECSNDMTTSYIILKAFDTDELDDRNERGLCRVSNKFDTFMLNKFDIYNIYVSNKVCDPDYDIVNSLVIALHMGGSNPIIKTSFKINPDVARIMRKEK